MLFSAIKNIENTTKNAISGGCEGAVGTHERTLQRAQYSVRKTERFERAEREN